jgi:hypothetical protein
VETNTAHARVRAPIRGASEPSRTRTGRRIEPSAGCRVRILFFLFSIFTSRNTHLSQDSPLPVARHIRPSLNRPLPAVRGDAPLLEAYAPPGTHATQSPGMACRRGSPMVLLGSRQLPEPAHAPSNHCGSTFSLAACEAGATIRPVRDAARNALNDPTPASAVRTRCRTQEATT